MKYMERAFNEVKRNYTALLGLALAYAALEVFFNKLIAPGLASASMSSAFTSGFLSIGVLLILYELVRLIFVTGYFGMLLAAVKGETLDLASFKRFLTMRNFKRVLIVEAIVVPIFIAGFAIIFVPGIYWYVIVSLSYFIVLDPDNTKGIVDSIADSIELTRGFRWLILGYFAAFVVLSFIGMLNPLVSIIIDTCAVPIYYMALCIIYTEAKARRSAQVV